MLINMLLQKITTNHLQIALQINMPFSEQLLLVCTPRYLVSL